MGLLLPKAKSISDIADVQDCGVASPTTSTKDLIGSWATVL
ncbi:hypothetical protein P4418_26615 [Bacillus thuringiensis]|nr:hypothetical protein [Bacillus thuringiensis]MED3392294.1 hypothetical protein [Bacillus thuringiensis]